jgi:hypothetical protein
MSEIKFLPLLLALSLIFDKKIKIFNENALWT